MLEPAALPEGDELLAAAEPEEALDAGDELWDTDLLDELGVFVELERVCVLEFERVCECDLCFLPSVDLDTEFEVACTFSDSDES